jgi:ABC-type phosphate transport system substrate-binding protein
MKKLVYSILLFFAGFSPAGNLFSQEIQIESTRFVLPIFEKWITEYKRENPDSQLQIKTLQEKGEKGDYADLQIVAHSLPDENREAGRIIYLGRYALLPVSNTNNPLLEKAGKGLKKKDLINLVFEKDLLDEEFDPEEKPKYTATVYTRGSESSTAIALAEHFDRSPERIKGKKIFGDEIYLLKAIQKDETGIAFNILNYVYDLKTRQLKSGINILPLHLKSRQKEALESHDIDRLISLLEETRLETIPVENFGLQISAKYAENSDVTNFIRWILEHGQEFNHECGFLTLDRETFAAQKTQLDKNNKEYLSYSK